MAFFESSAALSARMNPLWTAGAADFRASTLAQKPVVVAGGVAGAVVGAVSSLGKTVGVAAFEYYDKSLGESRGRKFFEYVTRSPLVHTLLMGVVGSLVGLGVQATGFPWAATLGIATTFAGGVGLHLGSRFSLTLPEVFSARASGAAGRGLTLGREFAEWFKKPLGDNAAALRHDRLPPQ